MTSSSKASTATLGRFESRHRASSSNHETAGVLPFLLYELRRHLPPLALAFLLPAALPIVRRLVVGDWRYFDGSWNVWGGLMAAYLMAPLMALTMAATGWPRERSLHLLEWLYARPLRGGAIFVVRALAIVVPLAVWSALALVFQRVSWTDLEQALSILPGLPGPWTFFFVQLGLALGAGLVTSALAPSGEWAMRAAVTLVASVWVVALGVVRLVGPAALLRSVSANRLSSFLDIATAGFVGTIAIILIAAAWRGMARAPDSTGRLGRAASLAVALAVAATAALMATLQVPRLAGAESPFVAWLGGEAWIAFGPARGIDALEGAQSLEIMHPIVRDRRDSKVLRDLYAFRFGRSGFNGQLWIHPARGVALLPAALGDDPDNHWFLIDREGTVQEIEWAPGGREVLATNLGPAIGWSASGERFAWKWFPTLAGGNVTMRPSTVRLTILEGQSSLRTLDVAGILPNDFHAAWIDDRTLLLTEWGVSRRADTGWWRTLDAVAGTLGEVHQLPPGLTLTAPPLQIIYMGRSGLPSLDGEAVALLVDRESANPWRKPDEDAMVPKLVWLDPSEEAFTRGLDLPRTSLPSSMGNLDDGSLVWAAPERNPHLPRWDGGQRTQVLQLRAFGETPASVCTMPTGRLHRFIGQSGAWAVWDTVYMGRYEYEFWGCNLATGDARRLDEWSTWAHPQASITDRGLFTASGWVPIEG